MKKKKYSIVKDMVHVPIDDAIRIQYLLQIMDNYAREVGPRDLRGHEEETKEFILALPNYDSK